MKQAVKDYLSYSRKELIGVFGFVILLIVMAFVPLLLPESKPSFTEINFDKDLDSLINSDGEKSLLSSSSDEPKISAREKFESVIKQELFPFDPNTISDEEWKKLGVRENTIITINKYKSRGGVFRKPEDILKLYGLADEIKKALLPYVKISSHSANVKKNSGEESSTNATIIVVPTYKRKIVVDINAADSAQWESLPGIGSKLAARIVKLRDRLGGFASISQVSEVYGLPDSTFQNIRSMLTGGGEVLAIDLNTADEKILAQHPYIQYKNARLLVQYRNAHGPFRSLDDLNGITALESSKIEKLKPYLRF